MFRCGIAYPRCRWIVPLLLLFAVIFDLIAVAAQSGWVENDDASHYSSLWNECRGKGNTWKCRSLMEFTWAVAVAALMTIGLLLVTLAFIISICAMCKINYDQMYAVAGLLGLVALIQFIALIIYPINFNDLIFEGNYFYTWAYGFGWGATILCFGLSILLCCLPNYSDEIEGSTKPVYLYESS